MKVNRTKGDRASTLFRLLKAAQLLDSEAEMDDICMDPDDVQHGPIMDIQHSNNTLYSLVPFLEGVLDSDFAAKTSNLPEVPIPTEHEADAPTTGAPHYENNILDKFPLVDRAMAKIIASISWARHLRIRSMIKEQLNEFPVVEESRGTLSSGRSCSSVPSSYGTSSYAESTFSSTSFATTVAETSGNSHIPNPPVPLFKGVEFQCNICFKLQTNIFNKYRWKYVPILYR